MTNMISRGTKKNWLIKKKKLDTIAIQFGLSYNRLVKSRLACIN